MPKPRELIRRIQRYWYWIERPWHITDKLEIPPGLFLEFLPAYSPELQPAERLWPLLDESIMNKVFDSLEELKQVICDRAAEWNSIAVVS